MPAKKKIVVKGRSPAKKKKVVAKAKDTKELRKSAVRDVSGLTIFEEVLCIEFLKDFNQSAAFLRARDMQGMKRCTMGTAYTEAGKLFQKPAVVKRLGELRGQLVDRMNIDLNRVMDTYGRTAFSTAASLTKEILAGKKLNQITDIEHKLHGYDVVIEQAEDGSSIVKLAYKQAAVNQALNSLTRILGGFKDNLNLTGKVSVIGQILDDIDGDSAEFNPGE